MDFLKRYMRTGLLILLSGDLLLGVIVFYGGLLTLYTGIHVHAESLSIDGTGGPMATFIFSIMLCSFGTDLYCDPKMRKRISFTMRIIISNVFLFIMITLLYRMAFGPGDFQLPLLFAVALFGLLQLGWHLGFDALKEPAGLRRRVVILGTGPLAQIIGNAIQTQGHDYRLLGYIQSPSEKPGVPETQRIGTCKEFLRVIERIRPHVLVVSLSEKRGCIPFKEILASKLNGCIVEEAPSFYEKITGKLLIEHIYPSWFIFSDGFRAGKITRLSKGLLDRIFSVILLVTCFPALGLIALLIKMDTPGPVIFSQNRVGRGGKNFRLYKFRTMVKDAEAGTGPQWARENDPRITRVGRVLRKLRVDELPQLVNVLHGDLSLVGPRPERPEFVKDLEKVIPYYSERHFIKPGITGWAQVNYPYGASTEDALEKLRFDLYYMKHMSIWLDLFIFIQTFLVVILGRGAR